MLSIELNTYYDLTFEKVDVDETERKTEQLNRT